MFTTAKSWHTPLTLVIRREAEQFPVVNNSPHTYIRSNWRPCAYSWSYPNFLPLTVLKYLFFSSRLIRPLSYGSIRQFHSPQSTTLLKTHISVLQFSRLRWLPRRLSFLPSGCLLYFKRCYICSQLYRHWSSRYESSNFTHSQTR